MDERGPRPALTTIYFLLPQGSFSRWHQVASDEVWHLYEGGPLELLELSPSAQTVPRHRLGPVANSTEAPVCTISAGMWQAARPLREYAFVGCTVGPGFDFADFRLLADDQVLAAAVRAASPDLAMLI
jgi:hypothetical protein